jgi:hypothetical protein
MRTRTTTGLPCPLLATQELAWTTSGNPRTETQNPSAFDLTPTSWTTPNGYNSLVESIQDELGTDGRFRDCLHTVETNEFYAPFVRNRFPRSYGGNAYVRNVTNTMVNNALGLRVPPTIDMDAYADQALAFMLPRLNEGLSLVNFILELKDLKHMDPRGSFERVKRRHLAIRHLSDPRTRKEFQKELVTRLNNAALNASFGINPFVKDVVQIYDDLTSLAKRLEQLKRNASKPQQRHYKRVIPASSGVSADRNWHSAPETISWAIGVKSDNNDNGGIRRSIACLKRARWILRPVYHATMRYTYTLPEMDSQLESIYAYLDTLGVRLDPSIVWNAIPFSFVVDWVVDVSGFLGSFARDNYPINVQLLDFCHSYKWHKEAEIYLSWLSDQSLGSPQYIGPIPTGADNIQIYKGMRSNYTRVRERPDIHSASIRGPKLRHAALSASLLLSRTTAGRQNKFKDLSRLFYRK